MFAVYIWLGADHALADVTFLTLLRAFGIFSILVVDFTNLGRDSLPVPVEDGRIEWLEAPESDEDFLRYTLWLALEHFVDFVFILLNIDQFLAQRFCWMLPHHGDLGS